MTMPIILPDLGVPGATLSVWFVAVGDVVYEGDLVMEIAMPGATFGLPAPATGRLTERSAFPRDVLVAGQVLGWLEATSEPEE